MSRKKGMCSSIIATFILYPLLDVAEDHWLIYIQDLSNNITFVESPEFLDNSKSILEKKQFLSELFLVAPNSRHGLGKVSSSGRNVTISRVGPDFNIDDWLQADFLVTAKGETIKILFVK